MVTSEPGRAVPFTSNVSVFTASGKGAMTGARLASISMAYTAFVTDSLRKDSAEIAVFK
ncbi:hypothetical protein D3C73_874670 [compost metagenome]